MSSRSPITTASTARWGLLFFLLASGLARAAAAQTGTGGATGTTTLASGDLLIVVQSTPGSALPDFDLQRFFNISNCQCDTPVSLYFTFSQSGFQKKFAIGDGTIEFWIGSGCDVPATRNLTGQNCLQLGGSLGLTSFATTSGTVFQTTASVLSQHFVGQSATSSSTSTSDAGATSGGVCGSGLSFGQTIWALVTFANGTPYNVVTSLVVNVDLSPPPPPTVNSVLGGNEALIANWTGVDTSLTSGADLLGYQLLCDRGGALQVFPTGTFSAGFRTCSTTPIPSTGLDANVNGLDPKFICSPMLSATTTSYRIKILENDITYGVGVVAIDTHYNASSPIVDYQKPTKTLSFYDVYRNGDSANMKPGDSPDPGRASGGYCAVGGDTGGGAGAAGLAAVVASIVLAARRRRRRRQR